eukprot:3830862-Prymnesium_polylepis.1
MHTRLHYHKTTLNRSVLHRDANPNPGAAGEARPLFSHGLADPDTARPLARHHARDRLPPHARVCCRGG